MIEVVAALIRRGDLILICQRPATKARALLWEFPGGKVEAGESPSQALQRECQEELGITPKVTDLYLQVEHRYPDLHIRLSLFNACLGPGIEPEKLEHNDIRWVSHRDLEKYSFCPADRDIIHQLCRDQPKLVQE